MPSAQPSPATTSSSTTLDGLDTEVAALNAQLANAAAAALATRTPGTSRSPRHAGGSSAGRNATPRSTGCAPGSSRSTGPGYGQIAATLPPCWDQHTLCLYTLDWLSELWSTLYLDPERSPRTLAAQAEWQTRLLPAAAEQMAREATRCTHMTTNGQRPSKPTRQ